MFTQDEKYLIREYEKDLRESEKNVDRIIEEMKKTLMYQDDLEVEAKTLLCSCIHKLQNIETLFGTL